MARLLGPSSTNSGNPDILFFYATDGITSSQMRHNGFIMSLMKVLLGSRINRSALDMCDSNRVGDQTSPINKDKINTWVKTANTE